MRTGQKNKNVEARLLNYSMAAGALLMGASRADANVVYTDVDENGVGDVVAGEYFNINFGGGDPEFYFRVYNSGWAAGVLLYKGSYPGGYNNLPSCGFLTNGSSPIELQNLAAGAVVQNSPVPAPANAWRVANKDVWMSYAMSGTSRTMGTAWTADDQYIGVKVKVNGTVCYGWIRVKLVDIAHIKVYDYAYENAGASIACGDGSLPVELSSFSARYLNGAVHLSWATESETDNLGYLLERKTEASDWNEIASYASHDELEGAGNTSSRTEYAFADVDVLPGEMYSYRLSDVDTDGNVTVKDVISIELDEAPTETALKPATPNPFNPKTNIVFDIAENTDVNLSVVDMMGRTVQTIIPGQRHSAGSYSIHWNGKTDAGLNAASGVYLLVLKAGSVRKTQKVMLVR